MPMADARLVFGTAHRRDVSGRRIAPQWQGRTQLFGVEGAM